jgi:hypothetical protein
MTSTSARIEGQNRLVKQQLNPSLSPRLSTETNIHHMITKSSPGRDKEPENRAIIQ